MTAFAKLLDSPAQIATVTLAIESAIAQSFEANKHPMRHMTSAEVKRRFDLCASIFEKLRGDLKWGITRATDQLPIYLNETLSGRDWMPDARTIWTPGDGG